ncbi:polyprenyl synthetase family protein [Paenarthrobacter sp. NPDC089675]|uniref:polyprenyl synthetase family protein n=1 Tax=Paenarthrobacter TaxID=1742992 RepID=UPI00382884E2
MALELLQAAALIHEDIIGKSDTGRDRPSVRRRSEAKYDQHHWTSDSSHFGHAAAIMAGSLCLFTVMRSLPALVRTP